MDEDYERWAALGFSSKWEYDQLPPEEKTRLNESYFEACKNNTTAKYAVKMFSQVAFIGIVVGGLTYCYGPHTHNSAETEVSGADDNKIEQTQARQDLRDQSRRIDTNAPRLNL